MKKNVGLWIDHKKAVIFSLADEGAKMKRILSELKENVQIPGGAQNESEEELGKNSSSGDPSNFYDEVVDYIFDAESILIFGPGEAKRDLKIKLENKNLHGNIVGFESADKMTDNQIVAKVRQHFLN